MKICLTLDSNLKVPGGVQTYVRGLYDSLVRRGHSVTILTSSALSEQDRDRRIISLGESIDLPLKFSISIPIMLTSPFRVDKILDQEQFDIIHISGHGGMLSWWVTVKTDRPVVASFFSYHSSVVHRALLRIVKPFTLLINSQLAARIAISRAARQYSRILYPGDYRLIPAAVDRERYYPEPISADDDNPVKILFVGRLDPRKGVLHLIRAVRKLSVSHWQLVVAGDGPQRAQAERMIEEEGLDDKVTFVGRVPDDELPDYYRAADIYCSPAIMEESFGIVLIEAMASGLPVVAYGNRGYREVLGQDMEESIVEVGNINMLSSKLEQLIREPATRTRFKELSLHRVERYEWDRVAEEIESVYQDILR